ncbi:hypothetical protein CG030_15530 [Bordetella pertussis]|nr:hypothetical protein CG030_15530 [Bordetella pertussis]
MVFAVLALVAVGVFGALAASVEHQGGMVAFDQALARALGCPCRPRCCGCCPGSRIWAIEPC